MSRPSWDEYFMDITNLVAKRSTCLRRKVGADNGAPSGIPHCLDVGCLREEMTVPSGERHELCRGLHAEQNAIIQAAYHGVGIRGATLFCTNYPCTICIKMLVNAGIKRIVYQDGYCDELAKDLIQQSAVEVVQFKGKA
jgi:dCMP deaminase